MAELKSFMEYMSEIQNPEVHNMKNPLCIKCNECCSLLARLTEEEYNGLVEYLSDGEGKKIYQQCWNKLKRYRRKGTIYMMCPFTDDDTKKCRIYDIRPKVCREFHCSHSKVIKGELEDNVKHYAIFDLFFARD